MTEAGAFEEWWRTEERRIATALCELVAIETVPPHEERLFETLERYLAGAGLVTRREPFPRALDLHPHFTPHPLTRCDASRSNLRAVAGARGGRPRVVFNAHVDVVPTTVPPPPALAPRVEAGRVHGRGSCDTKNNIVMVVEAIRFLQSARIEPSIATMLDLVVEEEIGGNGTLATIVNGAGADAAVVLEPTGLEVLEGHRGCVTAQIEVDGRPAHMGRSAEAISAIDAAAHVIDALRAFESEQIRRGREHPWFASWPRAVQVNVGAIRGGEWPGSVPARCTLQVNAGFLPEETPESTLAALIAHLAAIPDEWTARNHRVTGRGIRTAGWVPRESNSWAERLRNAARRNGVEQPHRRAWSVSCDARLYPLVAGIPAVIFGSGSLRHAHSGDEHITLDELARGTKILADFMTS